MFCKNCGTEINSSDKFCYKCGFNLQEDKPNKTLTEQEIEKDFEKLDSKISAITNNSNNINSTEYLRKKSITLFLFLFPFTSLWGIHHFYNKRHLRGILYITLSLIFNKLTESTLIENNFFIAIIIVFLILYFFVTDLNWIIKLPKLYFVKNKYQRKTIILASFIPVFLFLTHNLILFNKDIKTINLSKTSELINVMELTTQPEETENILKELGIESNSIISINYDDILVGNFSWEQSNFEFTEGTEKGYRIKLNNGDELIAYSENGKLLGIKIIGGDYLYANDKVLMKIDEAKQLKKQNDKKLEEEVNKKVEENKILKIGETKDIVGKEITINSVEFKKDVHPAKKNTYYTYYESEDGQVYIHIVVSVKNLEKQAIFCDEVMNVTADYNNGYTYTGFAVAEDDTLGFTYANIRTIEPLQTKNVHYLISVPEEVQTNKDAPLLLKFNTELLEYKLNVR